MKMLKVHTRSGNIYHVSEQDSGVRTCVATTNRRYDERVVGKVVENLAVDSAMRIGDVKTSTVMAIVEISPVD